MKLEIIYAALVAIGVTAMSPSVVAQLSGGIAPTSYVVMSFTGEHQGRFPAVNCVPSQLQGQVGVVDLVETTPSGAPAGFGSFDVKVDAACVTPFFYALINGERMTVVATFVAADGTPAMTYSMANAKFSHVKLSATHAVGSYAPYLELSVAAPQVVATVGGVATPASSTGQSSGGSKTVASKPRPAKVSMTRRERAPSIHTPIDRLRSIRRPMIASMAVTTTGSAAPSGVGGGWLRVGPRGSGALRLTAKLTTQSPPFDRDLVTGSNLELDAGYAVSASTRMPAGPLQLSLGPVAVATDAATMAALGNAGRAHAQLTTGVLALRDAEGTSCITITLRHGKIVSYQIAASSTSNTGATVQTLQLGFDGFAITDIGSGKTAQTGPTGF